MCCGAAYGCENVDDVTIYTIIQKFEVSIFFKLFYLAKNPFNLSKVTKKIIEYFHN